MKPSPKLLAQLVAGIVFATLPFTGFAENTCYVTSSSGGGTQNSLLYHLANQRGASSVTGQPCDSIKVNVGSIQPLQFPLFLLAGNELDLNGKAISFNLSAAAETAVGATGCLIDILFSESNPDGDPALNKIGESTLTNGTITTNDHHGICLKSTNNALSNLTLIGPDTLNTGERAINIEDSSHNNTLSGITASKYSTAIEVAGDTNALINMSLKENNVALLITGDANHIGGGSMTDNSGVAAVIAGARNIVGKINANFNPIAVSNNNGGVLVAGSAALKNRITRSPIFGNTSGIVHVAGGNADYAAPDTFTGVFIDGGVSLGIAGLTEADTFKVELFLDDGTGQGKAFKQEITTFSSNAGNASRKLFYAVLPIADLSTDTGVVTTATGPPESSGAAHTSEFSSVLTPKNAQIDAIPDTCLVAGSWFLAQLEIALEQGTDPWDEECEGITAGQSPDGKTNAQEDTNRNCVVEPGETDPCAFTPTPGQCSGPSCPADGDNDGIEDALDNCPAIANTDQKDADLDGVGDTCDNCASIANPRDPTTNLQSDVDNNGVGDVCEDLDQDGIANANDNCPGVANPDQFDLDGDTAGDVCDPDDDNDGLSDSDEVVAGTDARQSDTDADGVCDGPAFGYGPENGINRCVAADDNCPLDPNASQLDSDEDGIGDQCDANLLTYLGDTDSDGDGKADRDDKCPHIADNGIDTDNDTVPDACDNDDDNDGLEDVAEIGYYRWVPLAYRKVATDEVSGLDAKKVDTDKDGLCDGPNAGALGCAGLDNCPSHFEPTVGSATTTAKLHDDTNANAIGDICETTDNDADRDGIIDSQDNCPITPNTDQHNIDSDAQGDACDPDNDNDGLMDWDEGLYPQLHAWEPDSDHYSGNGFDDFCDGAGTGFSGSADTVCGASDNCPIRYNPDQKDSDGTYPGDACDDLGFGDRDGDTIGDASDNCPDTPNTDQLDTDKDGKGDVCDKDDDNDTIIDKFDNCPFIGNTDQLDTDGNNVGDVCDVAPSTSAIGSGTRIPILRTQGGALRGGCSLILQ